MTTAGPNLTPDPELAIVQISSEAEIAAIRDLMREYMDWAVTLDEDARDAPTFAEFDRELETLPGIFGPPGGGFLLATYKGAPAGCVAFRRVGDDTAELKRMYVSPGFRGKRIGNHLVSTLLDAARRLNYRRVVLDSYYKLTAAHAIYRSFGFREVGPTPGFPEELRSQVVFMELDLD